MTEQKNNLENEQIVAQENTYLSEDVKKNKTMALGTHKWIWRESKAFAPYRQVYHLK